MARKRHWVPPARRKKKFSAPDKLIQRGLKLQSGGKHEDAAAAFNQALLIEPDSAQAMTGLGTALRSQGKFAAAAACQRRALTIEPSDGLIHLRLGNILKDLGRLEEAVEYHRRALYLLPDQAVVYYNLGIALKRQGKLEEALAHIEIAHTRDPDSADFQWDRALLLLHLGDFERGWPAYEARWKLEKATPGRLTQPRWQGERFDNRTLLLIGEQGFGDSILASRFIPQVKSQGGKVCVRCRPEVVSIIGSVSGVDDVVVRGGKLPAFDLYCPMMSLPGIFETDLETIPPAPYLRTPDGAGRKARALLSRARGRFKIGIVWSGSVTFKENRFRATELIRFLRFLEVPGVQLFSLQKGPPAEELNELGTNALVTDLGDVLDDFADTAAVIEALDLVIMTDSAVAHLAGALGRPVWLLLPFVSYWLWSTQREDSPWYPSIRLFRQKRRGEWDEVFERAAQELRKLVEGGN